MKRKDTTFVTEAALWPRLFRLVCWYCGATRTRGGVVFLDCYMHTKCDKKRTPQ